MRDILEEAKKRMMPLFPTASEAWNANTSLRATTLDKNDPIEAINLFRTIQYDDMLPGAFFLAAQLTAHARNPGGHTARGRHAREAERSGRRARYQAAHRVRQGVGCRARRGS